MREDLNSAEEVAFLRWVKSHRKSWAHMWIAEGRPYLTAAPAQPEPVAPSDATCALRGGKCACPTACMRNMREANQSMSIIATPPAPESGQTDLRAAMPLPWSIVINENCNALLLDAKGDAFAVMKGPRHAENARILLAALATQPSAPQESGELAKLREAVPDGASIGKNGVTYYGIEEIYWHFEDGAALHMCLDKAGIPRADEAGIVYSLWGRVQQFATPQEMIHRIGHALFLADVLIDSVPTRAQNSDNPSLASIGEFVNGKNGAYRPIRDAKKEFFAHFSLEAKFVALPQDLSAEGDGQ